MDTVRKRRAGGIVIGSAGTIALVRNQTGTLWFFPKGGVDNGESDEDAARREIAEEASLSDLGYIDDLGTYERPRIHKDGTYNESELAEIHMYLFAAPTPSELQGSSEIIEARWVSYRDVASELQDAKDKAWYASVFDRVREAIQRD